jgi:hypothetical protein
VSQVNLLPPDILQRQGTRKLTVAVIIAGAVLLGLILAFFLLQVNRLSGVEDDIRAAERNNAAVEEDIEELQPYEDLQIEADQQVELLQSAYRGEMSFSQAMMDLSKITPSDSYLQTFGIGLDIAAADGGSTFVGTLNLSGQAIGIDTVALWINRIEEIEGWVNPWVASVDNPEPTQDILTFPLTADLTSDALTPRGRGEVDPTGG